MDLMYKLAQKTGQLRLWVKNMQLYSCL